MTPKKRRMKRNVLICKLLTGIFAIVFVIALAMGSNVSNQTETNIALVVSCLSLGLGVTFYFLSYYLKMGWWNGLSVDGRAEEIGTELHQGKRDWYMNPMVSGKYIFAALRPNNLNEFGGGKHIKTNRLMIDDLLAEGKIENDEITRRILYHFDAIL